MVTIEQKLDLFAKIMQQDIDKDVEERYQQIQREYEEKKEIALQEANKKAIAYIEEGKNNIDIEISEIQAKVKIKSKQDIMKAKEKFIEQIYDELYAKIMTYTETTAYQHLLRRQLRKVMDYCKQTAQIYVSEADAKRYKTLIVQFLSAEGLGNIQVVGTNKIRLGGIILKVDNMQIDLSLDSEIVSKTDEFNEQILERLQRECEILE
ncbi:MAG: hypothetical protein ATN35_06900 [Epulopiscium sp. Nele67-Bin004]|nr:MAG: hypothetical protein ATN35_06900 [Epulopiscium sp. Nele67-Bin004]